MKSVFSFQPIMGTVVNVTVYAGSGDPSGVADSVVADLVRIEAIFSGFRPDSNLSRWRSGDDGALVPELAEVLAAAERWHRVSEGRFNPMAGVISAVWAEGAERGVVPSEAVLAEAVASIRELPYRVDESGSIVRTGDCSLLNLNAIAKGYAVDVAVRNAMESGAVSSITVNAGGDLRHCGSPALVAAVENPLRAYDNEPPLCRVTVDEQALATSGQARRGVRIGGEWFGHCLDPRTGHPVDRVASVSVLAPDAMTADAVATVLSVTGADDVDSVGYLVVEPSGALRSNEVWDRAATPLSGR